MVAAGRVVADLPIAPLTDEAPVYRRPAEPPSDLAARRRPPEVPEPEGGVAAALERLLATPELASKEWIWRQYDHTVRTNTVVGPGGDCAVLALKGTPAGAGAHLRRQPGLLLARPAPPAAPRRSPRRCATWPASAPSRWG